MTALFEIPYTTVTTFILAISCVLGDKVFSWSQSRLSNLWLRALVDNFVHAAIGGLSWAVVVVGGSVLDGSGFAGSRKEWLTVILEVSACTLLASMVDLDHFYASRSLQIEVGAHCSPISSIIPDCIILHNCVTYRCREQ